jgi:hypothetical protein
MGYIIGGQQRKLIVAGTDANFKETQTIPNTLPKRSNGNFDKSRNASLRQASYPDVTRTAPLFNDPRYTSSSLSIPSDQRTLNGLYRYFAETDPICGASLRMHTDLPLADLRLGQCEDTGVQQHFEEMWERINGYKLLNDIASEYHEIGDVVPFGAFNESDYMWDQFAILNPDYVKVEATWINQRPLIKLIPDETLKKVVQTQSPRFLFDQLPNEIKHYVLFNQEIPLDPNNTFQISHAKRPYELKGKSLIKRILKMLMLEDRFNQANFALATRHAVPLTVVKVGDPNSGYIPNDDEIDAVRDLFAAWELDPNFSIYYHYGIDVQFYGSNGRMLPIGPELDRIYRLKFIGLGMHEQLMTGQGGSYAQAYIGLEVQRQRYLNFQLKLENFVHSGVFKPIADLCGFYRVKQSSVGFATHSHMKYGKPLLENLPKVFSGLRDYQDNKEFKEYITKRAQEQERLVRDYVYPKLDWGAMSAASDENLKNYIKWLADNRPHLVDDATLARMARLDRDTQEKAFMEDIKRKAKRYKEIANEGLLNFMPKDKTIGGQGGGGGDFGGGMDLGGLGGPEVGLGGVGMGGGEEPAMPIGEGGPPETSQGQVPPQAPGGNPVASALKELEPDIVSEARSDDIFYSQENLKLMNSKKYENLAMIREMNK